MTEKDIQKNTKKLQIWTGFAKLIGTSLNRVFRIYKPDCFAGNLYKVTEDGIKAKHVSSSSWHDVCHTDIVNRLLNGLEITEEPFVPQMFEEYFLVNPTINGGNAISVVCGGTVFDYAVIAQNMAYKTEEEALENVTKDIEIVKKFFNDKGVPWMNSVKLEELEKQLKINREGR